MSPRSLVTFGEGGSHLLLLLIIVVIFSIAIMVLLPPLRAAGNCNATTAIAEPKKSGPAPAASLTTGEAMVVPQ